MSSAAVDTETVHLCAMIMTDKLKILAGADLQRRLTRTMGERFIDHYRLRANDVIDVSPIPQMLGIEEQPLTIRIISRNRLSDLEGNDKDPTRIIDLPARPGVIESFERLMKAFLPDESRSRSAAPDRIDQMVDPATMRQGHRTMKGTGVAYPLCSGLLDFWMPEEYDFQTYIDDTQTLERALIRRLGIPGTTTFYDDLAFRLIAYGGMLSRDESALRRMHFEASELIKRFWTSNERGCLVRRREAASAVLKAGRPYLPEGSWATMTADELEYARARQACIFPYEGGTITKTFFRLDAEYLNCMALVRPGSKYPVQIGVVALGDDMPQGRSGRVPPALMPAA